MTLKRILVVDDEPNLSNLVRMFLVRTKRYEVLTENRSSQAVKSALTFQPDLILLDVDMPGKDGGEVNRDLKATPALKDVPVIFFTSLVSHEEAGKAVSIRGGTPFLAKPVNPDVLITEVDRMLAGLIAA